MGVIGTFGSFTTARLAIYASQASLNVTGNNIANINTTGYTRQRMDLVSLNATGTAKYASSLMVNVGYGVLCKGTSQIRDPYLDIRFRNENSKLGEFNAKLEGLNQISHILDEVGKGEDGFGVIEAQMGEFLRALRNLSGNVGSEEFDDLVQANAKTLATYFNSAADDLETIRSNEEAKLNESIESVNSILTSIRDLNVQIRTQGIYGDQALELRDARNNYIDELSEFMHINVEYSMEKIDQYTEVEKLTISLADVKDQKGNPIKLVDGIFGGQITMGEYLDGNGNATDDPTGAVKNEKYLMQVEPLRDQKGRPLDWKKTTESEIVQLDDTMLTGSLQAMRELLTEEGVFASADDIDSNLRSGDPEANIKKGIPYYERVLDNLARMLADTFNKANQLPAATAYANDGANFLDADGQSIGIAVADIADLEAKSADASDPAAQAAAAQQLEGLMHTIREKAAKAKGYEFYDGGVLFSNNGDNDDPSGITAKNISVSNAWSNHSVRVLNDTRPNEVKPDGTPTDHSSRNQNILHMISLFDETLEYSANYVKDQLSAPSDAALPYFKGSFREMFTDISATLGQDAMATSAKCENYSTMALDLDNDRLSVSGVDLNEEATNMMQFQKSYSAACRLLTTLDSVLDKLINGTAV